MSQATGQTQPSPAAKPAQPQRPPVPKVPPEFDAMPIWRMPPAKLVALVQDPQSTLFQKAIACKKLAFVGGKEAIRPMAALLGHPQLSCYARFGLEPNPDPSVDEVFRAALPKLTGLLKVGVINSIGVRKDARALDALTPLIDDRDPEIGGAAAAAVGQIGGVQAARVLQAALDRTRPPVFPVVARASLICAEGLMAGHRARALELYQVLSEKRMPEPVMLAAIRILNAAGPAPPGAKDYPPPTGEAAERDRSGFLGREP